MFGARHARRGRVAGWLRDHLPTGLLADPYGWFLAGLCIVSGLPTVLGISEPSDIEAQLRPLLARGWGACLVIGGLGMLCGLTSIRRDHYGRHLVTRVPCFRLGLRLLGIAAIVYAYAVASAAGAEAIMLTAILVAFAATHGVRLLTLGSR